METSNWNDWSKFKLTANFNRDIQTVYDAWTTQDGLEYWFLRQAHFKNEHGRLREKGEYIRAGDTYEWLWHGYSDEVKEEGEVLEVNGKDRIKFTFSGNTIVTVSIYDKDSVTLLDLIQENIPEEKDPTKNLYTQCSIGWTFYLANLKSVLEGGLDIRNKNLELSSDFK